MPLTFKIGNLYEEICSEPHDTQNDALVVPRIPFDKDYMGIAKKKCRRILSMRLKHIIIAKANVLPERREISPAKAFIRVMNVRP